MPESEIVRRERQKIFERPEQRILQPFVISSGSARG
jgi:hypothetical protein